MESELPRYLPQRGQPGPPLALLSGALLAGVLLPVTRLLLTLLLVFAGAGAGAVAAQEPERAVASGGVALLRVQDELGPDTVALFTRGVRSANGVGARTLIVELDTPGGEIDTMWGLAKAIEDASDRGLRTVAWIQPRALSAGALLALFPAEKK